MLPEEIEISQNISDDLQNFLKITGYDKLAVLVDENTRTYCLPLVESVLNPSALIEITSGEENKTLDTCFKIWEELTNYQLHVSTPEDDL